MTKTIEFKVTAHDLRSTFGNIIDYVVTEAASLVEGWTAYEAIGYNRDIFGYRTWEITLENREDEDNPATIADVYIQYHGILDETPDNEVVAEVSITVHQK